MTPLVVFLHDAAWDRMHHGLSAAAAAVALGRPVHVAFFWWALERLVRERLDEPDLPGRGDVADRMERRGMPSLRQLLELIRSSEHSTVYACTGSMAALGLTPPEVRPHVDRLAGWAAILSATEGATDRLSL